MVQDYHNTIAAEEYKGRPMAEVLIEVAVMQRVMLQEIVEIKNNIADLDKKKANKTEFQSWETRFVNVEKKQDTNIKKIEKIIEEQTKWKGMSLGLGAIGSVLGVILSVIAIINYLG